MANDNAQNAATHTVLVNDEEQYSLWPVYKKVPEGWRAVGKQGTEEECMKYVDEVWTDMRPLSLRKKMDEQRKGAGGSVH